MLHVLALLQRIVDALPLNSRRSFQFVESDEILTQCVASLNELARSDFYLEEILNELLLALDRLHRPPQLDTVVVAQLLDSQTFLLRIVSSIAEHASSSMATGAATQLDGHLVQRALSCSMALYLQASLIERWAVSSEATLLSVPRPQKTSSSSRLSVSTTISRSSDGSADSKDFSAEMREQEAHIRLLISFVSTSNWAATYDRLESTLRSPYVDDFEEEYNQKLKYVAHLKLSASGVDRLLSLVASCLDTLQKSTQLFLVECLVICISNWLKERPQDIAHLYRLHRRYYSPKGLELFDHLLHFADNSKRKAVVWPLLSLLVALHPMDNGGGIVRSYKRARYLQSMAKTGEGKLVSTVLQSYSYIIYAASHLEVSLREHLSPVLNEIYRYLTGHESLLADSIDQGIFTSADDLLSALVRLRSDMFDNFTFVTLNTWLEGQGKQLSLCICAIRCVRAVLEESSHRKDTTYFVNLLEAVSPRIQAIFVHATNLSSPNISKCNAASSSQLLRYTLDLIKVFPEVLFTKQSADSYATISSAILRCIKKEEISMSSPAGHLAMAQQKWSLDCFVHEEAHKLVWEQWICLSADSIRAVIGKLSSRPIDIQNLRQILEVLQFCISERLATIERFPGLLGSLSDVSIHEALVDSLEVSLLNLTCHVDYQVATQAARTCQLILGEARVYGSLTKTKSDTLQNVTLYETLGQATFLTIGRNAVQKKVRACLRSAKQTLNVRRAWLETYDRWELLTDRLFQNHQCGVEVDGNSQLDWQNHTGFLAAMGRWGNANENDTVLRFISRWREVFLHGSLQSNASIGETSAEILGNELHFSLFVPMIQEIQILLSTIRDKKGVQIVRSRNTLLVEHLIVICRGLFERLDTFLSVRDTLEVDSILLDLANYLQICGQSHSRSRLRFCQFIASCAPQFDLICVHQEARLARRLCNYLANWISPHIGHDREMEKLSRETNTACLKALAILTKHLLFFSEPTSSITQVFGDIKDFVHFVLPLLQMGDDQSSSFSSVPRLPLLQEILSNILAMNRQTAFTTYISLCYSSDCRVKSQFASAVISRLEKGVGAFRSRPPSELLPSLWRVVLEDNDLLITLLDGPSQSHLVESIYWLCERQGKAQELFSTVVETELENGGQESELYRRNSPTTRLFALFVHEYASDYIETTLREPLKDLESRNDSYSMELDSSKLDIADEEHLNAVLEENRRNFETTALQFIDAICSSAQNIPTSIARLLHIVAEKTAIKFPNSVHKSVGSFLILRMLGPAIMKHVVSETGPRMRRQILVVVKVLTNVANNTYFKEEHMQGFNNFLNDNILKLSRFLVEVCNPEATGHERPSSWSEAPPIMSGTSIAIFESDGMRQLLNTLRLEGDRFKVLWAHRKLQRGMSVEAIRGVARWLKVVLTELNESTSPIISSQKGRLNSTCTSKSLEVDSPSHVPPHNETPTPTPTDVLHMVGFSRAGRPVFYVAMDEIENSQSSVPLDAIANEVQSLTAIYNRNDVEVFIDLTGTGDVSQNKGVKQMFTQFLTGRVAQHCHSIYLHNINYSFCAFIKDDFAQSILSDPTKTIFLDHSEDLQRYFDTLVCARLTAKHGQLTRSCSDDLFFYDKTTEQSRWSYRLTLHRNEVLCFSTSKKHEVFPSVFVRIVETTRLDTIADVQVANELLTVLISDGSSILLYAKDSTNVAQYLKFALLELKTSTLHYREQTNNSEDVIRGLLLCLGLLNLASTEIPVRDFGVQILLKLLPTVDLFKRGLFTPNSANLALLDAVELTALHQVAKKSASSVTQVAFVQELISRLPHIGHAERRAAMPCLHVWLADLSAVLKTGLVDSENQVRTIIAALLDLYSPTEDSRLVVYLWGGLARQVELQDLIFESLCSSALKFDYASSQVSKATQIFRVIRNPFFISKIIELLVERINVQDDSAPNLMMTKVWSELTVLLRILVELTARATSVLDQLPKILYVVVSLLKLGPLDIREMCYNLLVNAVSASVCDATISDQNRERLCNILLNLDDTGIRTNMLLETSVLSGRFLRTESQQNKQPVEIASAILIKVLAEYLVEIMKLSSGTQTRETSFLETCLKLITDAAFQNTVMSRRSFMILGVLSKELQVDLTALLLEVLVDELPKASSQTCIQLTSVIMCLSTSQLNPAAKIFKLALALCMIPLIPVASAGLQLLLRCLEMLPKENSIRAIEDCFCAYDPAWLEYQKFVGISMSAQKSLGIVCVLLRTMRITGTWDLNSSILRVLIKIYTNGSAQEEVSCHILPMMMLLCAHANSDQDFTSVLEFAPSKLRHMQGEELIVSLFKLTSRIEEGFGLILLSLICELMTTTTDPVGQINMISALVASAEVLPQTFLMLVDDSSDFLRQMLLKSANPLLLRALWDLIKAEARILRTGNTPHASRTSMMPKKRERLRQLGFEYLTMQHHSERYEGDMKDHSARIANIVASII